MPCRCRHAWLIGSFLASAAGELGNRTPQLDSALQTEALKRVQNYPLGDFGGPWMAFVGKTEIGKTYAFAALIIHLLEQGLVRQQQWTAIFVPWRQASVVLRNPHETEDVKEEILRHKIILLDDVGWEHVRKDSTWMASIISELISTCFRDNKMLFVTSNLSLRDFCRNWLDAASERRFRDRGKIIEIKDAPIKQAARKRAEGAADGKE